METTSRTDDITNARHAGAGHLLRHRGAALDPDRGVCHYQAGAERGDRLLMLVPTFASWWRA
jgi:hypothetical protein